MDKLRVGVVGVGYLGKFHAEKYARLTDAELVGVVDTMTDRAEHVAAHVGTSAFTDYRDLIDRVDAVSISVPTPEHFTVARDFLTHGKDVLIEKPMTVTLEEADALLALAREKDRIIQVGHLERFNPAVVALNGQVRQPRFIESHRLSQYKQRCNDVSVVLDLMIHDIDIILSFVRSEVRQIFAAGTSVVSGHVDIANARLEFENGCVANVTASRISMKNERKIRLFQQDAYISVDFANHEIVVVSKDGDACLPEDAIPGPSIDSLSPIPGLAVNRFCFAKADALDAEIQSFVRSVRGRKTPEVTGQMGRDALLIALTIQEQIHSSNQSIAS